MNEDYIVQELLSELDNAKIDGSRKNIISDCPYCMKKGRFGVYIGKEVGRKKKFAHNCFKCGFGSTSLEPLLKILNREDLSLNVGRTMDDIDDINESIHNKLNNSFEPTPIVPSSLPDDSSRIKVSDYLNKRGFTDIDYKYWEVYESKHFMFKDYVVFPVIIEDTTVGYVGRHTWSKRKIERHNARVKRKGEGYNILRYRNSKDNDFVSLLYGTDKISENVDTVIIVEGIFDVISTTRKLNLYNNDNVKCVASFGKKVSDDQMFLLQELGIKNTILAYDPDAVKESKETSNKLSKYFNSFVLHIDGFDDIDDLPEQELIELVFLKLKTYKNYNLDAFQMYKLR